ncbi:MAG: chemotaxis protein CheW [Persicimonas sp.]
MKSSSPKSDERDGLREHIRALEAQLLSVRRRLDADSEPLPEEPFAALEVRIGQTWYALPIEFVVEVLAVAWPQPLVDAPDWVLGCVDVGGEIFPLIDLQQRLDGEPLDLDPSHAMVLMRTATKCAFAVNELGDVVSVDPADLAPPAKGIHQTPFLLGSLSQSKSTASFVLSARRLSREFVLERADESEEP